MSPIDTTELEIKLHECMVNIDEYVSKLVDSIHYNINESKSKSEALSSITGILKHLADTKRRFKSNIEKIDSGIYIFDKIYRSIYTKSKSGDSTHGGMVSKQVVPNLYTHVIEVETLDAVPDTPLCYITSLDQFAIKINGAVLRGNIGKIVDDKGKQVEECMIEKCSSQLCSRWHDPYKYKDGYYYNIEDNYCKKEVRNYSNRSWMYSPKKHAKATRHIGDRTRFDQDIYKIDHKERNLLVGQTMHDILTCVLISKITDKTLGVKK